MPKTEEGQSNKSRSKGHRSEEHPSPDTAPSEKSEGRFVTEKERADLIEDAKAFKKRHDRTFRILSDTEGNE
jgi:hypothetical protein